MRRRAERREERRYKYIYERGLRREERRGETIEERGDYRGERRGERRQITEERDRAIGTRDG
jgi:hypothetical protein